MRKKKVIIIIAIVLLLGFGGYALYEHSIDKKIEKLNISKAETVIDDGYEEIDLRYVTVNGEKHKLRREFKNSKEAMNKFKKENPKIVKILRDSWIAFGDLSWWNWGLYSLSLQEDGVREKLEGDDFKKASSFFYIYGNKRYNRNLLKRLI